MIYFIGKILRFIVLEFYFNSSSCFLHTHHLLLMFSRFFLFEFSSDISGIHNKISIAVFYNISH